MQAAIAAAGVQKPWLKQNQNQQWGKPGGGSNWGGSGNDGWGSQSNVMAMMKGMMGKGGGGWQGNSGGWKSGGKWKSGNTSRGKPVPEDFSVDENQRFQGTVENYNKWKGFGFVTLSQTGLIPDDSLFVFWKSIQSDDRFPQLKKEMAVEFSIQKSKDNTVTAVQVTMPGGANIAIQDDDDAATKTFVGGQHLRYTGTLKWYDTRKDMGMIDMDDGYALTEPVPKELQVEKCEVNAAGKEPVKMQELSVEFGIWKTQKGAYKAYNMTLPGGVPVTQEALENRQLVGAKVFQGEVEMWMPDKNFGFIKVGDGVQLPPNVVAKLKQIQTAAAAKGKTVSDRLYFRTADIREGCTVQKEQQVQFQVYTDDKGAGACDVH